MKNIDEFKEWLKSMERYERISGSKAEEVLEFVEKQQEEIESLKNNR